MLRNFLTIAFRLAWRHRGQTLITLSGLTAGIASCLLILMWVQDETGYDRFHERGERIGRILIHMPVPGGGTETIAAGPPSLAPALQAGCPGLEAAVRVTYLGRQALTAGARPFYEKEIYLADPAFLRIFSFPLEQGDGRTALDRPDAIVLTRSLAVQCFGSKNALGQTIRLNNQRDVTVTGVLADPPARSHLQFKALLPFSTASDFGRPLDTWDRFYTDTYVLQKTADEAGRLSEQASTVMKQHNPELECTIELQPLSRIHLYSARVQEGVHRGDISRTILFSCLATFILLMACINYLNLVTARSTLRAREIGLRKVAGGRRSSLLGQFLTEAVVQTLLATGAALLLIHFLLPGFNELTGKNISLAQLASPGNFLLLAGFILLTGLLAGWYPAWYLSGQTPLRIMKSNTRARAGRPGLRRVLVVFQFSLTLILLAGSGLISRQLNFLHDRKPGFDKERVVMLPLPGNLDQQVNTLKQELNRLPAVLGSCAMSDPLMHSSTTIDMDRWEGRQGNARVSCVFIWSDGDFLQTHGIGLVQGRFFGPAGTGRPQRQIVINETAARAFGFASPVGKRIGEDQEIVGVVRDFHQDSLHQPIAPLIIAYKPERFEYLAVKLAPGPLIPALESLKSGWQRVFPRHPFDYSFLDQLIDRLYRQDQRQGTIIAIFTGLSLLIANLGLFGLATHLTQQRTREIGIRKVLGDSAFGIVQRLCREFLRWVLLAALLASPVAYLTGERLLQDYAYRVPLQPGYFLVPVLWLLLMAILAVGWQVIRAARTNPAVCLRHE